MCNTGKCPHELHGNPDTEGSCGYKGDLLKDHPCFLANPNATYYKFIEIILTEKKPKTNVYEVYNLKSGGSLGTIRWYGAWRQYCFYPDTNCIFSVGCLQDIINFINKVKSERR